MNNPFVSIIVPCYNQSQFLSEALQSVLDQTYIYWECIIVNDGSKDNTHEVAQEWLLRDSRFKYVNKENGGLSSARNAGIDLAKGEFILPLDADDKISKDYLEFAIEEFHNDEKLKVVYCRAKKFGIKTGVWDLPEFSIKKLAKDNMIFCTAMFKKKQWEIVGGYDTKMLFGLEDWEFWISILKNGGEVRRINNYCFFYRIKEVSMYRQIDDDRREYSFKYMSVKHADFFVNQLGSFIELDKKEKKANDFLEHKLKSEKFVIDLFCKTFFKFTIFGNKF
jgi:glycosyltransferase involved in cell wall biosynthesis